MSNSLQRCLMSRSQVYREPLCRRHYSSLFGEAVFFRLSILAISIAMSLVVAYATGGFWVKLKPDVTQASVHYTYDAVLVFEVRIIEVFKQPGHPNLLSHFPARTGAALRPHWLLAFSVVSWVIEPDLCTQGHIAQWSKYCEATCRNLPRWSSQ